MTWKKSEKATLRDMFLKGCTTREIAEALGRTVASIQWQLGNTFGSCKLEECIEKGTIPDEFKPILSDAEMVAILREHGWTVTCTKTQTIEI